MGAKNRARKLIEKAGIAALAAAVAVDPAAHIAAEIDVQPPVSAAAWFFSGGSLTAFTSAVLPTALASGWLGDPSTSTWWLGQDQKPLTVAPSARYFD
jgi:hypothetical protein